MALFGFGKKKNTPESDTSQSVNSASDPAPGTHNAPGHDAAPAAAETDTTEDNAQPDPVHDAINGSTGPFDGDSVAMSDFDFSDFADGVLNLGSVVIPLPRGSEVQVEMGERGPRMLHIITPYGRLTPVAFAAPRTAGQWRTATKEIADGMRGDGLNVAIERGPWGREVVGGAGDAVIRIIGVDGPRWMLRMTLAGPAATATELAELGREVTARVFVHRGQAPMPAGQSLPVTLPDVLAQQVQQAMQQRSAQAQQVAANGGVGATPAQATAPANASSETPSGGATDISNGVDGTEATAPNTSQSASESQGNAPAPAAGATGSAVQRMRNMEDK